MPWPLPSYSWITFPASLERAPLASFAGCSIYLQIFLSKYLNLSDDLDVWIYQITLNSGMKIYFWLHFLQQGAGHSGWEDALQSNQYHYLHHRFPFEIATYSLGSLSATMVTVELRMTRSLEHFVTNWRSQAPHTRGVQRRRYPCSLDEVQEN